MKRTLEVPFLSSVRSSYSSVVAARVGAVGAFALAAVALFGCPVYSGSTGEIFCDSQGNCCDETSGNCYLINCDDSRECPGGSTCVNGGFCASPSTDGGAYYDAEAFDGGDGGTTGDATTDCSTTGCQPGFTCTLSGGSATCMPTPDSGHTGSDAGSHSDGGAHDGGAHDATHDSTANTDSGSHDGAAKDASDARALPPFTGCTSDSVCVGEAGVGARCLNGTCVAAANTCFDTTQCPFIGGVQEECVQGVCTPSCATTPCPTGYSCDPTTNVCTGNPTPCGAVDGGAACAAGTTCVDEHCVPLCTFTTHLGDASADASGETCSEPGLVCVDNGCIPSQSPNFLCTTQGQQDTCAMGSICLHHNCYIACEADAGADGGNTCQKADNFNQCKAVVTSTGTYDVCGSNTNLGSQCNPTQGQNCLSPAICIDGYCR
jgi:hypothetical protein